MSGKDLNSDDELDPSVPSPPRCPKINMNEASRTQLDDIFKSTGANPDIFNQPYASPARVAQQQRCQSPTTRTWRIDTLPFITGASGVHTSNFHHNREFTGVMRTKSGRAYEIVLDNPPPPTRKADIASSDPNLRLHRAQGFHLRGVQQRRTEVVAPVNPGAAQGTMGHDDSELERELRAARREYTLRDTFLHRDDATDGQVDAGRPGYDGLNPQRIVRAIPLTQRAASTRIEEAPLGGIEGTSRPRSEVRSTTRVDAQAVDVKKHLAVAGNAPRPVEEPRKTQRIDAWGIAVNRNATAALEAVPVAQDAQVASRLDAVETDIHKHSSPSVDASQPQQALRAPKSVRLDVPIAPRAPDHVASASSLRTEGRVHRTEEANGDPLIDRQAYADTNATQRPTTTQLAEDDSAIDVAQLPLSVVADLGVRRSATTRLSVSHTEGKAVPVRRTPQTVARAHRAQARVSGEDSQAAPPAQVIFTDAVSAKPMRPASSVPRAKEVASPPAVQGRGTAALSAARQSPSAARLAQSDALKAPEAVKRGTVATGELVSGVVRVSRAEVARAPASRTDVAVLETVERAKQTLLAERTVVERVGVVDRGSVYVPRAREAVHLTADQAKSVKVESLNPTSVTDMGARQDATRESVQRIDASVALPRSLVDATAPTGSLQHASDARTSLGRRDVTSTDDTRGRSNADGNRAVPRVEGAPRPKLSRGDADVPIAGSTHRSDTAKSTELPRDRERTFGTDATSVTAQARGLATHEHGTNHGEERIILRQAVVENVLTSPDAQSVGNVQQGLTQENDSVRGMSKTPAQPHSFNRARDIDKMNVRVTPQNTPKKESTRSREHASAIFADAQPSPRRLVAAPSDASPRKQSLEISPRLNH